MKKRIFAAFMLAAALLVLGGCKDETSEAPAAPDTGEETPAPHVHDLTGWRTSVRADCTNDGTSVRSCRSCEYKETKKISALGHRSGEWQNVTEASCTDDGERYKVCSVCSEEVVRETVSALGHNYEETLVYPNRYAEGYTMNICSECNDGYKEDFKPPFGQVQYLYTINSKAGTCRINSIVSNEVTELHIPDYISDYKVVALSDGALEGLDNVRVIRLPEELATVGDRAFAGCKALEEITFGTELYSIGKEAFLGCTSLNTIVLPEHLDTLGEAAFSGCSALVEIALPSMITEIPAYLFDGCTSLRKVEFDTALAKVGTAAFRDCERLEEVSSLLSVSEISASAFARAMSLKSLTFGDRLISVGRGAFLSADSIETVNIPSVESWLGIDFADGTANPLHTGAALYLDGGESPVTEISVSDIPDYSFFGYKHLEKLTLTEGAENIGTAAFYGCSALVVLEINAEITAVGDYAFYSCYSLDGVKLPETAVYVGDFAFAGCASLASAELPEKIDYIGAFAFSGCSALTEIEILAPVIGESAFLDCVLLETVTFAEGISDIGANAFSGCIALSEITIPEGVVSVGKLAFANCQALTKVYIPVTVAKIGADAFIGCDAVTEVHIGSIDAWLVIDFASSKSNPMTNNSVTYLDGELLSDIVISDLVESISDHAFSAVSGIENVYYTGTKTDFLAVIGQNNPELIKLLLEGKVYFYSPSKPAEADGFWYYSEFGFVCKW